MPTLNELYSKFGEAAEAAQLLETEIGNILLSAAINAHGLQKAQNKALAKKVIGEIDRKTLGQLIQAFKRENFSDAELEITLSRALSERNRLNHSFYREHNLRKGSEEGRMLMILDLQAIHDVIMEAYMLIESIAKIPVSEAALLKAQSGHLPL